jgi:ABC-type multidrug transport system ATPase subunit
VLRRSTEDPTKAAEVHAIAERAVEIVGVRKCWPQRGWGPWRTAPRPDVFSNVDFAASRGEIVAILGENGAGKTTLLKIVAGLARPDAGDVRIFGCNAIAPSSSLRRRVAYAGGERGFYFRLTVRENLAFFAALDGLHARERSQQIVSVARIVDIESELDRRFADLSSGVRQRLSIARALIADPEVLLLDEPTRALDPQHASTLRRFVRETLAGRFGKTIIVGTNLIDEALTLGDRIAVLRAQTLRFVDASSRDVGEFEVRALLGMASDA